MIINRALFKYGYSYFSLEILEFCDVSILISREQYYFDWASHLSQNRKNNIISLKDIYNRDIFRIFKRQQVIHLVINILNLQ